MTHDIPIPGWRPARDNQIGGGTHWSRRKRLKDADAEMVAAYTRLAEVPRASGKRRVSLRVVLSGRQQEVDPYAYCKSLLDALVRCGMLVDDDPDHVEWVPPTYRRGDATSTTIVLEDLP